ncbi:cuticle protein 8-like isoform X16 [Eriocheir sinensis]|uniref:cuticle protein 8-like isoform X16 n=1 Tax=Eriocheir sinensis TaxID=95602 RepID=UPI0021C5EF9F|nr:cuticle protein 8-like isoform X16 [Eriocheir sinensis]
MVFKLALVSALVAVALADQTPYRPPTPQPTYGTPRPSYSAPAPSYSQPQQTSRPQYQFDWAVNDAPSGNDYGHQESRDGYDTQGNYYVQLPDGRLQRVDYTVNGDSGFVAQVTYEGEAQYPQQGYGSPRPSYGPPAPTYGTPAPTYGTPTPAYGTPTPAYG